LADLPGCGRVFGEFGLEVIRSAGDRAPTLRNRVFCGLCGLQPLYFREKPGFDAPVRQFSETGFLWDLRLRRKYFREKPGFSAPVFY